jgi:palmitoyltransferase
MVMCFFHLTWVYMLLAAQVFQMICQGMTTNEKMNAYRYTHLLRGSNPFNRGVCANCADFFGFTMCRKSKDTVDWTKTYEVPPAFTALASEVHSSQPQVRIPLPFSSSWDPQRDGVRTPSDDGTQPHTS